MLGGGVEEAEGGGVVGLVTEGVEEVDGGGGESGGVRGSEGDGGRRRRSEFEREGLVGDGEGIEFETGGEGHCIV